MSTADELQEIVVTAREPRYVAPTKRDGIGRIWAPVYINDKGPFRLALDTGASRSGLHSRVVDELALRHVEGRRARIRGVTGSETVPLVHVDSLVIGDLEVRSNRLPIISDPLGGADGILGNEGLSDKRIYIDFKNDFIMIRRSKLEPASAGFITIPVEFGRNGLMVIDARIGFLPVKGIVDTGGQVTIANLAARDALRALREHSPEAVIGVTEHVQHVDEYDAPPIAIGNIRIRAERMAFGDMHIFDHWNMTDEPAVIIGMDALGLLDTLIIDYARSELQVLVPSEAPRVLF